MLDVFLSFRNHVCFAELRGKFQMRIVALATVFSVMLACSVIAQDLPKDGPPKDEAKDVPKDLPKGKDKVLPKAKDQPAEKNKDGDDAAAKAGAAAVTTVGSLLCIGVPIVFGLIFYFTPTAIGFFRGHPNMAPIMIVNLFLGWTLIGWVVALTWSFTAQERHRDDYGRRSRRRSEDD